MTAFSLLPFCSGERYNSPHLLFIVSQPTTSLLCHSPLIYLSSSRHERNVMLKSLETSTESATAYLTVYAQVLVIFNIVPCPSIGAVLQ